MKTIENTMDSTSILYRNCSGVVSQEEIEFQIQAYSHPHEQPRWTLIVPSFQKN